jgi:putative membrane protein
MAKRLIASWIILGLAFVLAARIAPGFKLAGGFAGVLWVSALFALLNLVLGSILRIVTAPIMLLTLGLFGIVINAVLLRLIAAWSSDLKLDGFGSAIWGAILISVFTWLISLTPLGGPKRKHKAKH